MDVDPVTPVIGATVSSVDLTGAGAGAVVDQIYELLVDRLVLFFPGQQLDPADLVSLARAFGELDAPHHVYPQVPGHPEITLLENDGNRPPNTDVWHTDLTLRPDPPFASLLYSKVVPACGGDTLWASMQAAYDALPQDIKGHIAELEAVHAMGSYWNQYFERGGIAAINRAMAELGAAVHPVVKIHPVTGARLLYVNQHFTVHVLGMSSGESQRLLNYLFDHINQPDFQLRHRWQPDTVVIWDNRATQHYAVCDYLPALRRMHRVTVINDRRCEPTARN